MPSLCTGSTVDPRPRKRELPPLILHPFNDREVVAVPEAVMVEGLTRDDLNLRYSELRMLCFIGRDLNRWLEHCAELVSADPKHAGLTESSLIRFLLFDPPVTLVRKMRQWEVSNYQIIFTRALGLNSVFLQPPVPGEISGGLLRNFQAYADALFDTRLKLDPGVEVSDQDFEFEIYASGEYIALLEKSWNGLPES